MDSLGFSMFRQRIWGFTDSKMANLGLRVDCNILLDIFGTFKNQPNMDPRTSYLLPEKLKINQETTLEHS